MCASAFRRFHNLFRVLQELDGGMGAYSSLSLISPNLSLALILMLLKILNSCLYQALCPDPCPLQEAQEKVVQVVLIGRLHSRAIMDR